MKSLFNRRSSTAFALNNPAAFGNAKALPASEVAGKSSSNQNPVTLLFCILMDLIGYATYSIPFLG
ncbi:MAG: hypothetical protein EOO02_07595, partial [Chitinophagaceae bacterium]